MCFIGDFPFNQASAAGISGHVMNMFEEQGTNVPIKPMMRLARLASGQNQMARKFE